MSIDPAMPALPERPPWPVGGGAVGRLLRGRDWSETGLGPPEQILGYQMKALAQLDFAPEGLSCRIAIPLSAHAAEL